MPTFSFVRLTSALIAALCLILTWRITETVWPLHADEAVQWSLAEQLNRGNENAYSVHQDRFHGPTLGMVTCIRARLSGTSFEEMSPEFLRWSPQIFLGIMALAVGLVRGVSWWIKGWLMVVIFLTGGLTPYARTYIQEMLLAAGMVWGAALVLRAKQSSHPLKMIGLAGACFGWALACKVTALAYLVIFLFVGWWLGLAYFNRARIISFALGLLISWAMFQSVIFTDLHGLSTWWQQLGRAFGVAAGISEDTLFAESYAPWFWTGAWLALVAYGRWWARARLGKWGQAEVDLPLLTAALIFLFHTALPYKTPWLLLTAIVLPLVLVVPVLLSGTKWERFVLFLGTWILIACSSRVFVHTPTLAQVPKLEEKVAAVAKLSGPDPFYIAIEGGHYWPLPYYLRKFNVGYGTFPRAEVAPLRLLPVTDASQPKVEGYQTLRLHVRTGEDYWVLVANSCKGPLMELLAP